MRRESAAQRLAFHADSPIPCPYGTTGKQVRVSNFKYAGFTAPSATSGPGEKGPFSHLASTLINISHCIYHTFPLGVCTLPPSKGHASPEPRVHSDHYCVSALYIIARTCSKVNAMSMHTQSDAQWHPVKISQLCSILDWEMSLFSHHAMRKWASPSLSLVAL